jgi:hypothetical protein
VFVACARGLCGMVCGHMNHPVITRAYTGDQLQPGEQLLASIIIGAPDADGKSDLHFRAIQDTTDNVKAQKPIARLEIYRGLRRIVHEFCIFLEAPARPETFNGSTIADCEATVKRAEKANGQ